jgi:hypothetical protein
MSEKTVTTFPSVDEMFEQRLVDLLGLEALMHDSLSPYEIARRFYMAGNQDGFIRGTHDTNDNFY